jgi:hypothetical protein
VLGHAPKGGKAAKPIASAPSKGDGRGNVGPNRCNLTHMKVGDSGANSIDKSSRALREDSSMKVLDLEDNKVGPPDSRQLHVVAAKVLMKIMYGARFARPDLLRAVCVLARRITNWDEDCDKRLLRLISYINSTLSYRLKGWINDSCQDLQQQYFSDADVAGCLQTQRSTTGSFGMIWGENSSFPISMTSKRQTCVSHSTPEAELVAMDTTLRVVAMPSRIMWDTLVPTMKAFVF